MPDDVWPISPTNPGPKSLSSGNGIGFDLKGFTREDADGYRFATRWFIILGLPIFPVGRYYLRQVGMPEVGNFGVYGETVFRYQIAGTAQTRLPEILRTYAFGWLTPIAAIWPLIALLQRADDLLIWVPITAVVVWPGMAILLTVGALSYYQEHWAPLREVHWRTDQPRHW